MPSVPGPAAASPLELRTSGLLVHPTSLPGPHGAGDLGSSRRFARFLADAGQSIWQMLPVCPIGRGNSPYDSESSFAGAPSLVSLDVLRERGWLRPEEVEPKRKLDAGRVRFDVVREYREPRLRLAFERFERSRKRREELDAFMEEHPWVSDWALYRALRLNTGQCWVKWERDVRQRRPAALARVRNALDIEVRYHAFVQLAFDEQWTELRACCRKLGIRLLGDVPMFVAHDSAEVWASPELFFLDPDGNSTHVAGVPPDAFSRTGQLWGNPLYRWDVLKQTGFSWWIARLRSVLSRFDAVRLDHFIAFHRYWEVPAGARTALHGRFVIVPGHEFLVEVRRALGGLPLVAEDLGLLTPEVESLRDAFGLPGMKVLQFAFDDDPSGRQYLPHRFPQNTVAYTGTHDNDTTLGWFRETSRDARRARALERRRDRILAYVGGSPREVHWSMIRAVLMSVANTAIFPLQDLLGLDSRARMNVPGKGEGNWEWRVLERQLLPEIADRMRGLCEAYDRIPGASW